MINDSTSWGTVEGPISTFLCRAAFYVVGHPSPATKAELAEAREKDLLAKVSQRVVVFRKDAPFEIKGKIQENVGECLPPCAETLRAR